MGKKDRPFNNPFQNVKLAREPVPEKKAPPSAPKAPPRPSSDDDDAALFLQAVGEVAPVKRAKGLAPPREPPSAASLKIIHAEIEAMTQLSELVAGDGPFDL